MFFYMFSQYPVDENKLLCIKTVNKIIYFYLKKSKKFLTLCRPPIDVSHITTVAA